MITTDDLIERKRELQYLLESAGWETLRGIVEEQIKLREVMILTAEEDTVEDVIKGLKAKGERLGLKLALELPKTLIEGLDADIEIALREEGHEP